jgi:serine/threonine-protein kinase
LPTWVVGNPIPPALRIGKLLQGEYLIKGILGEGELGVTYEAENARLKRKFAVLMLKRELKPTQGMMLQVRDDLRHAEPLVSAGIMPVKMIVDHMMIPGFATELLEGETLRARLARGPLPPARALATVLAVAKAMDALHKAGAVHGDLRPENIFLVRPGAKSHFAGRVMIVEHALHSLRRRSQGLDDQLPLYKLMYRPPECLSGERGPHVGGDVFVLGAILHECMTGKPAFYDEVPDFVIDNLHQPPKPIPANPATGLTEELASMLSVLVASACARDPQVRTPDMAEIILAIEQVVQGAGLTLPSVITEEPQAAPALPATPTASRMNRLLNRLSGVFPQVPLPPSTEQAGAASKPGTPPSRVAVPGAASAAASVGAAQQAISLPPIAPPRRKVTRLLQKLSGVFPVLQVSPDGNVETRQSSNPKISLGTGQGPAAAGAPPTASGEAPPPASAPPTAGSEAPAPASAAPIAASEKAVSGPAAAAPAAAGAAHPALPTLILGESAGQPTAPAAGSAPPSEAATAPATMAPGKVVDSGPLSFASSQADQPAPSAPAASPAAPRPKTAPPVGPSEAVTDPSLAVVPPVAPPPAAEAARPQVSGGEAAAAAAEPVQAGKSSEVAKALALLRLQQQARAAGQPADALRVGAAPATPDFVVPAFMASPPGPASARSPQSPASAAAPQGAEVKSAASPRPAVPPSGTEEQPTGPAAPGPAAARSARDPLPMVSGLRTEAATPALHVSPSGFSPTGERPPEATGPGSGIAFDSTLQPNDLADFLEAAASLVESSERPKTLSEIPTRPAAVAGLEPIPAYTEAKTQPALRRLPITEQATQAKLNPDLRALGMFDKSAMPALEEPAAVPTSPSLAVAAPGGEPVAQAPVVAPAPATPASRSPVKQLDSLLMELEPASLAPEPAAPPPPPEKPAPPRPPRVSQLIKALQQGQIDSKQALQQASGSPREPAGHTGAASPPPPPAAVARQPAAPLAPTSPAAASSGPVPGRITPGLMPMAPMAPPSAPGESPWGTATQHVVPAPKPGVPAPLGLRGFLLRNQEAVAALFGALLVLFIGMMYLLWR